MYKFFSVMLVAFAISTTAYADVFGIYSSDSGPEQIADGQVHAPTQNGIVDGKLYGYPFYSGCCESKSHANHLWDGYCGCKGGGMKAPRVRHDFGKGGCAKGDCGKSGFGKGGFAKGDCGCDDGHGFGGKSGWRGQVSRHGLGGKGGCSAGAPCGSKGCDACDPCGPKHRCRLGLFDWLHFGHGHGCDVCGGAGCIVCAGGKGGFSKGGFSKGGYIEHGPVQGHDKIYYGTPSEVYEESTLQPPEVFYGPTSASDRSAWRRQVPANPFARPLGY